MNRSQLLKRTAVAGALFWGAHQMGHAAAPLTLENQFVQGEMIVKLKRGADDKFLASMKSGDFTVKRKIDLSYTDLYVVEYLPSKSMRMALNTMESIPEVEYAEPNFIYSMIKPIETISIESWMLNAESLVDAPNDPKFTSLWGLNNTGDNDPQWNKGVAGSDISALKAWDITKGSKDVKIAVIDTGIDYNHPDLKDNIWINEAEFYGTEGVDDDNNGYVDDIHGYDFAYDDGDPMDGQGHGTHCAGTIGAVHDNKIGVAGVMSKVTLVPVKFLSDSGSGTSENAIKSIDYATMLNVDIMSNSWGGGGFSKALEEAIQNASKKGIYFAAAAGNSSTDNDISPHYPSNYEVENVVSVAAHNALDSLASFSCFGKKTVHVAAPGRNILSTTQGNTYSIFSGTSMATPHVSGVLGLLVAKEGRIPAAEMRQRLMDTTVYSQTYRGKTVSEGRVDAYNFLTNTVVERPQPPAEDKWETVDLVKTIESDHPYLGNTNLTEKITIPGAKYIRVLVDKFDLERNYDKLFIKNGMGQAVTTLTGVGRNAVSDYIEGDTAILNFKSDAVVHKWGFEVTKVQVIW